MTTFRQLLRTLAVLGGLMLAFAASPGAGASHPPVLRVCADPNDMPFSNRRGEGLENRIAELLARDMNVPIEYTWSAQRRGFIRNTLKAGLCDVIIGIPSDMDLVATTAPYYTSSYAFVSRASSSFDIHSLDDPRLRGVKIGVQIVGDDGATTPPVHALDRRGIIENVLGFTVFGDYRVDSPPSVIVSAVARGELDVGIAWGPMAGYFAHRQNPALRVTPIDEAEDAGIPLRSAISMGVLPSNGKLRARLESFLEHHKTSIEAILRRYGVPH